MTNILNELDKLKKINDLYGTTDKNTTLNDILNSFRQVSSDFSKLNNIDDSFKYSNYEENLIESGNRDIIQLNGQYLVFQSKLGLTIIDQQSAAEKEKKQEIQNNKK